jgi:hypothetical protein
LSKSRARASSSNPLWGILLVAMLLVGTVVLTVAAVAHGRPVSPVVERAQQDETPSPSPTPSPADESTPTPTATPVTAPEIPRAQERFLLFDTAGTAWRAIAGSCSTGEPPLLERSADGGSTWSDVTPRYLGLTQVAALLPFNPGEAQVVGAVGSDCAVQGLRTYTQGVFWESYADVLAGASYLPPADPASAVTPLGSRTAPCAAPTSLSVAGDAAALICGTTPYIWTEAPSPGWVEVSGSPARAALVAGDTLTLARITGDCPGTAFSTTPVADPTSFQTVCRPDLDPASAIALAAGPDGIVFWSGDTVSVVD